MPPLILARQLSRCVLANGQSRPLLDGLNFSIDEGQSVHLIGPSGSGKTTLLRLLNRMDEPSAGELEIAGRPLAQWNVQELRRQVGLVFQESTLLGLTVAENLALPFRLSGESAGPSPERQRQVLERVELGEDFLDRREGELSVGQKQRVALARALVRPPRILLLDEPTSGLDAPLARRLLETLRRIQREENLTLIMATHRLDEVRHLGGRVFLLEAGRLVEDCPAERLFSDACSPAARRFLAEARLDEDATPEEGGRPHA